MVKNLIIETLKLWIHRIESGECTDDDLKQAEEAVRTYIDPKLTPKQAQDYFGVSSSLYRTTVHRKVMEKDKNRVKENTSFIRFSILRKLFTK